MKKEAEIHFITRLKKLKTFVLLSIICDQTMGDWDRFAIRLFEESTSLEEVIVGSSFRVSRHSLASTPRFYCLFSKGCEQARRLDWSEESQARYLFPSERLGKTVG